MKEKIISKAGSLLRNWQQPVPSCTWQSPLSHCQHHARFHGAQQPLLQDTQKTSKSSQPDAPESGILTWESFHRATRLANSPNFCRKKPIK